MSYYEYHKRSIAKSITYRVVVVITDFLVIYLFTHRVAIAIGLIVATNFGSAIVYYIHERAWNTISWGRLAKK